MEKLVITISGDSLERISITEHISKKKKAPRLDDVIKNMIRAALESEVSRLDKFSTASSNKAL